MPKELQYKMGNSQPTRIRLRYGLINPPLSKYVLILVVITPEVFDAMAWAWSKRNLNPHLGLTTFRFEWRRSRVMGGHDWPKRARVRCMDPTMCETTEPDATGEVSPVLVLAGFQLAMSRVT